MRQGNLKEGIPAALPQEWTEVLACGAGVRIERIVSRGHATPEDDWYDQDECEYVLLVTGAARLQLEGRAAEVELAPGDWIDIPAHVRHRVAWTDPDCETCWLVVFYPRHREAEG